MRKPRLILVLCLLFLTAFWIFTSPASRTQQEISKEVSDMEEARRLMVEQLIAYGVTDQKILAAMGKVPRHRFLPTGYMTSAAYGDHPLPIGHDQTISQPYIVAYMTERMHLVKGEKVLEIGTG